MSRFTVLLDNAARRDDLASKHGLSLLLSGPWGRWLLDAGPDDSLVANAAALEVDLATIDAAVLSHGHYDHAGGLTALAELRPRLPLYAHPDAFSQRYIQRPGRPLKPVGPPVSLTVLQEMGVQLTEVQGPMRVGEGLLLSGPIGGPAWGQETFVIRQGEQLLEDPFADELFVMARGSSGWAVICGCCHRGLANTLRVAKFLAKGEPIAAIVGGLHLRSCTEEQLGEVVEMLDAVGGPAIMANHCTGDEPLVYLTKHYDGEVTQFAAGDTFEL